MSDNHNQAVPSEKQRAVFSHRLGRAATLLTLPVLMSFTTLTFGFDNLNAAQSLVYDTPHLQNTSDGQTLRYDYSFATADESTISDRVLMSITTPATAASKDEGKRDVSLDFLSAERRLNLPDFQGYRGNPVIIAMLEHIAQAMGKETGGGVVYFRNRIRDALAAEDTTIAQSQIQFGDSSIKATQLVFAPFRNDSYLAQMPHFAESVFTISLSEQVPGGVLGVEVESTQADQVQFHRSLMLDTY